MALYLSRRLLRTRDDEASGELNFVPYLDILVNLIIFLLLSLAGLAAFGVVNATAPPAEVPQPGARPAAAPSVVVAVGRGGFSVLLEGAREGPAIARLPDGRFDYRALTEAMRAAKARWPAQTKVVIAADPDVTYETLVATMDATRETAEHRLLFPDVSLAAF